MKDAKASFWSVALPTEHGGWSLTLEPALLGLLARFSGAGLALTGAALLGFLARRPLKLALVDRWRGRTLARTQLARRVAAVEIALLSSLVVVTAATADVSGWWWPLVAASPLIGLELWYDVRSRSRALIPELAGSVGVAALAAAVALAGGAPTAVAIGLWAVAGARAGAAIPFVRVQLRRFKGQPHSLASSDIAQAIAVAVVVVFAFAQAAPVAGAVAVGIMALVQVALLRISPPVAAVLGAQQVVVGLTVVLATGLGAIGQFR